MKNKALISVVLVIVLLTIGAGVLFFFRPQFSFFSLRPSQKQPSSFPTEPITLTYWRLFDDEESLADAISAYRQIHPNVQIVYQKKDYETYQQELDEALRSGNAPDLFMLKHDEIPQYLAYLFPAPSDLSYSQDSKEDFRSQFQNHFVKAASGLIYQNQVYGLPLWMGSLVLFYQPALFQEALKEKTEDLDRQIALTKNEDVSRGLEQEKQRVAQLLSHPPRNWTEMIEVTKLLTKKDAQGGIARAAIALGDGQKTLKAFDILSLLMMQNRTTMLSEDKKKAAFHLPIKKSDGTTIYPGTMALDYYTSFARPTKETYTFALDSENSVEAFAQQKAAMLIHYSYYQRVFQKEYPDLQFKIAPLPQIEGVKQRLDYAFYWGEVVSKSSKHPEVAWDFLRFITSDENLPRYTARSQNPSPLLKETQAVASKANSVYLEGSDEADIPTAQAETAANWYQGKNVSEIKAIFQRMIDEVVLNNQSPQAAIEAAASLVTNLIQGGQE